MAEVFDPYHKWLGIRPDEQPPNCYRLLGIALFEEDADVIANAADQRMAHVRTFQLGHHQDSSQRLLNEIAAAKTCLLQPDNKAEYDAQLRQQLTAASCPPGLSAPPVVAGTNGPPIIPTATPPLQTPGGTRYGWWLPLALAVTGLIGIGIALGALMRQHERPDGGNITTTVAPEPATTVSEPLPPTAPKDAGTVEETLVPPSPPAKEEPAMPSEPERSVAAVSEPSPSVAPPTPPAAASPPVEETPERKASLLQRRFDEATAAAQFKTIAEESLVLVDEAVALGRKEVAKSVALLAIKASRKADDTELMKKAAIRYVRVERSEDNASKPK